MLDTSKKTLSCAIYEVLGISDARQKATSTRHLLPRGKTPRLRLATSRHQIGRIALLHAIAHIELNAVSLALDMTSRFTKAQLPMDFYHDWLGVPDDEARHFLMLVDRLANLGATYGDLPAHDGLWQAANATKHDLF